MPVDYYYNYPDACWNEQQYGPTQSFPSGATSSISTAPVPVNPAWREQCPGVNGVVALGLPESFGTE